MDQTDHKTSVEIGNGSRSRDTSTVRIRKSDLKRLEIYQVNGDDTPASAVSRVLDISERDSAVLLQVTEILSPKRIAKTNELIAKTEELLDILSSERQ